MHIRPAQLTDAPALAQLEALCFTSGDAFSLRQYRRLLRNPRANVFAVTAEAEPPLSCVGSLTVLRRARCAHLRIYSLALHPSLRGRGLGKALLDTAHDQAHTHGLRRVRLEVRTDNAAAISLYHKNGYTTLATRPNYYADGCAAQVMQKEL